MGTKAPQYAYHWAEGVVQSFLESNARGSRFLTEMMGITHTDLVKFLAKRIRRANQVSWKAWKRVIKDMDRYEDPSLYQMEQRYRRKWVTYEWSRAIDLELELA